LLALLLGKLSNAEVRAATLIFDARDPPPDRPTQAVVSGLKVLFANPGGDADVMIEHWLSRHPAPRRVTLVSSDRALQRAARGCGAKFLGSDEFLEELERRRPARAQAGGRGAPRDDQAKPAGHLSEAQTSYWMKIFGDVPTVDTEPDPPPEAAPATPEKVPTSAAPAAPSRPPQRRKSGPQDAAKSSGSIDPEELEEWLEVFGDAAEGATASADELRLADLEGWLARFQEDERKRSGGR
jgi:predicted RNA-binding protein with PIN domain